MDKRDMFDFAAIPVMAIVTVLAFVAAYFGWV